MNKIKETLDGPNGGVSMYQYRQGSVRMSQLHLLRLTRDFKSTPKTFFMLSSNSDSGKKSISVKMAMIFIQSISSTPLSGWHGPFLSWPIFNSLQLIYGLVVSIRNRVAEGHCWDWKVLPGEQCLSLWARNKFDFWFRLFLKHLSKSTCLIAEEPPPAA